MSCCALTLINTERTCVVCGGVVLSRTRLARDGTLDRRQLGAHSAWSQLLEEQQCSARSDCSWAFFHFVPFDAAPKSQWPWVISEREEPRSARRITAGSLHGSISQQWRRRHFRVTTSRSLTMPR